MNSSDILKKFAICLDNTDFPASLELHKVYQVVADENAMADGDLRVIDESGKDYLYSANHFLVLPLSDNSLLNLEQSFSRFARV